MKRQRAIASKFFSQEEQKLLIQTFFDDKIQRMLDGTCRDKQVYARIAEKLGQAGYERMQVR